jgi:hypothetical protein
MDIGAPKRIIEIEPATIPLPGEPDPAVVPVPVPETPQPAERPTG